MKVQLNSRIDRITDDSAARYALSAVQVTPASKDECFLAATNSRAAIVMRTPGEVTETCLIPHECLPRNASTIGCVVTKDGKNFVSTVKTPKGEITTKGEKVDSTFPHVEEVMPVVDLKDGWVGVALDPKQLMAWVDASGRQYEDGPVTLMFRLPKSTPEKPRYWVEDPIAAYISRGECEVIGAVMPCAGDFNNDKAAKDFNRVAAEYKAAVTKKPEPKEPQPQPEVPVVKVTEEVAEAFGMEDLPNTEVVSVPPEIVDGFNIPALITIAADSIDELRGCDVYRVISRAPARHRQAVADYINFHRDDMVDKVEEGLRWCEKEDAATDAVDQSEPEVVNDAAQLLAELLASI
jgi:hypothetical protein